MVALATWFPSALFNCVDICSPPAGVLLSGDVLGWLVFCFAHAPNKEMVAASMATERTARFFMGRTYPD
jgi:hypothetical protein